MKLALVHTSNLGTSTSPELMYERRSFRAREYSRKPSQDHQRNKDGGQMRYTVIYPWDEHEAQAVIPLAEIISVTLQYRIAYIVR